MASMLTWWWAHDDDEDGTITMYLVQSSDTLALSIQSLMFPQQYTLMKIIIPTLLLWKWKLRILKKSSNVTKSGRSGFVLPQFMILLYQVEVCLQFHSYVQLKQYFDSIFHA